MISFWNLKNLRVDWVNKLLSSNENEKHTFHWMKQQRTMRQNTQTISQSSMIVTHSSCHAFKTFLELLLLDLLLLLLLLLWLLLLLLWLLSLSLWLLLKHNRKLRSQAAHRPTRRKCSTQLICIDQFPHLSPTDVPDWISSGTIFHPHLYRIVYFGPIHTFF